MRYLDELRDELAGRRLPRRTRERILIEIEDHLACDPQADLGDPRQLASEFADQLGTSRMRQAALAVFGALAVAGLGFGVAFVSQAGGSLARAVSSGPSLSDVGAGVMVVGAQVAFVAGLLAVVRALRLRREPVVGQAEASIVLRRSSVALLAGIATMVGLALAAIGLRGHIAGWWVTLALSAAGAGAVALLCAAPAVVAAGRLMPSAGGEAADLYSDLGPLVPAALSGRPWRFAVAVAAAVAVLITLAGVVNADGFDGAVRGIADGAACLAGFGVLGRYLGLRN